VVRVRGGEASAMLDPASLNLTEPDSEQEALRCVFLEFAAAFPWFSHVARRCAYLGLESRVAREVKVHEVSTVRAVSLTHGSHLETGGIYFVGEGPGSGDFSASRVYLGYVVIMAMIPDNVYSAPRIGHAGHSEHLKAFGADRSLDHWFTEGLCELELSEMQQGRRDELRRSLVELL